MSGIGLYNYIPASLWIFYKDLQTIYARDGIASKPFSFLIHNLKAVMGKMFKKWSIW
jgi:hypothetical protein